MSRRKAAAPDQESPGRTPPNLTAPTRDEVLALPFWPRVAYCARVARRLLQAATEIAHDVGIDEIVVLQHAADALFMQVRCEQFGEGRGDCFQGSPIAAEMHIGFHRKARRRQNAFG